MIRIKAIKNDYRHWLYDAEDIKAHALQFFSGLYTTDQRFYKPYHLKGIFPSIDVANLSLISSFIDDDKIKRSIFNMQPLKAPGIDGFPHIFYQSQWSTVGPSFYRLVKDIFTSHRILKNINKTLIVRIPKNSQFYNVSPH